MNRLSTHILDISRGQPAAGVQVTLERLQQDQATPIHSGYTNADGRLAFLSSSNLVIPPGTYKLTFHVQPYFSLLSIRSIYPYIQVCFEVNDQESLHIPLLLGPYGYTTYRGS